MKAKKQAMLGYLSPDAADVAQVDFQIKALEKQKADEELKLTSTKERRLIVSWRSFSVCNSKRSSRKTFTVRHWSRLKKGRVEATRTLKKLTIVQSPSLPEYPLAPRRIYNVVVFALGALLIAGIAHLLGAIIRDHKD